MSSMSSSAISAQNRRVRGWNMFVLEEELPLSNLKAAFCPLLCPPFINISLQVQWTPWAPAIWLPASHSGGLMPAAGSNLQRLGTASGGLAANMLRARMFVFQSKPSPQGRQTKCEGCPTHYWTSAAGQASTPWQQLLKVDARAVYKPGRESIWNQETSLVSL